jgi:hypothetical protein
MAPDHGRYDSGDPVQPPPLSPAWRARNEQRAADEQPAPTGYTDNDRWDEQGRRRGYPSVLPVEQPAPPLDLPTVLVARCERYREDLDAPCTGRIRFRWGQSQAACGTCGAYCGVAVAAWERVEQPAPTARETAADDGIYWDLRPGHYRQAARETAADELAEAETHLRERLATCKRNDAGTPQSLTDHAIEIVLDGRLQAERNVSQMVRTSARKTVLFRQLWRIRSAKSVERGRERDAARAEVASAERVRVEFAQAQGRVQAHLEAELEQLREAHERANALIRKMTREALELERRDTAAEAVEQAWDEAEPVMASGWSEVVAALDELVRVRREGER